MRASVGVAALALGLFVSACGITCVNAQAQQPNASQQAETFATVYPKAHQECLALWSDHAFDWLRKKIPLNDEKAILSMLTSNEKLLNKEKPIADLAVKTLEKCRSLYAPAYSMLPEPMQILVKGIQLKQDALIAEVFNKKITFGNFNVGMNRLAGEFADGITEFIAPSQSRTLKTVQALQTTAQNVSSAKPQAGLEQSEHSTMAFHGMRLALVIGNSNYTKLPKLSNPANDARSIAEMLQKMGYRTQLLLDASDQSMRNEVRKFASDSSKAEVALVYYAGHGAQLNGSNYILPADIDIPRTEADIQFSGIKVDDLVNSIGSGTKIVFLDACRDNPALFKNIARGRGGSPIGLAPASASSFNQSKQGGGIFIAYATDAGAVADDGHGQHSPFTQALLRYMQKPVSIDDMYSLVTREVRLVTKNAQRPYKYASLENIVCLTPVCSDVPAAAPSDVMQEATRSADEELKIALQTKDPDALETYLQKYPETKERGDLLSKLAELRWSEFTEWTLFEVGNKHTPYYVQLSSLQQLGDRAAVRIKEVLDPSVPTTAHGKSFPDAAFGVDVNVYDCTKPRMAVADENIFDRSGKLLFNFKWADPQYLNLSIGVSLQPGSVGMAAKNLVCNGQVGAPLVSKRQMVEMKFPLLASAPSGEGEIFFVKSKANPNDPDEREVTIIFRNFQDHNVKQFFAPGTSIPDPPNFRTEVDRILLKCNDNKFLIDKTELWSAQNELVRIAAIDHSLPFKYSEFSAGSPNDALQQMVCGKSYGGVGLRFGSEGGSIKVAEVFSGSPADHAGIKPNDMVTHIDNEPVAGLSEQQLMEKTRGPAGSKVVLTIVRDGHDGPIQLTVIRDKIQMPQLGASK